MNPPTEPGELSWYQIGCVLRDAAWEGRWSPLDESNVGPLANVTAAVLVDEFARRGLRLVAEAVPAGASGGTEGDPQP